MNALLPPILVPMLTAIACLATWRRPTVQRIIAVTGAAALLAAGIWLLYICVHDGIISSPIGNWPAPFGIILVADLLSAIMVLLAGIVGLVTSVYSLISIDSERAAFGYYPLLHFLLMGVCGAFLAGDIFNLYVWFEIVLISSFVLLALGGEPAQMQGAIKYVALNLISSTLFLIAIGILYSLTGALNLAALAKAMANTSSPGLVTTAAVLFLIPFAIKSALFPFYFWLPSSYHTPPAAVSALFAGLLTKVGVYALLRTFTLLFTRDTAQTHGLLLVIASFTMLSGGLAALIQRDFRRLLSFQHISQIGYMILGLGLFTRLALAGSVFYIIHHVLVMTNLFFIAGVSRLFAGSDDLESAGGLYDERPGLAILFLIPALSLAGIPPLSGFFAKLSLLKAGLDVGQYSIVAIALLVALLTLYSITKAWTEAFWKPRPQGLAPIQIPRHDLAILVGPIILLATLTLAIGIFAGPVFDLALKAADQLLNPSAYVRAVLGDHS